MKSKIEVWNTERKYTRVGQVIGAVAVEGGVVFADVSRMVEGFVKATPAFVAAHGVRGTAMWGYDTGTPGAGGSMQYNYDWVEGDEQRAALDAVRKAANEFAARQS